MLQAFIIFLREGFESFLIVAIILAYLRKTGQKALAPAVYSAIATSIALSTGLGYVLSLGVNQSLWEGILGVIAVIVVGTLVIHMWRTGSLFKAKMEQHLDSASQSGSRWAALSGVFLFTVLMITREGMETALMLMQVRDKGYLTGIVLGLTAAAVMSWMWARFGHLINLKRFFQVTGIFLLLFMLQIVFYSLHEFSEAFLSSNDNAFQNVFHAATEPFSPTGQYGKWFSLVMIIGCALWLTFAWILDRYRHSHNGMVASNATGD
jgi:high-affinity iron transporter